MSNSFAPKLKAIADKIDPQTDGVAILIVGDVQYGPYGITSTGNDQFDAERLAVALQQAVMNRAPTTPAEPAAATSGSPGIREAPQVYPYRPALMRDGTAEG